MLDTTRAYALEKLTETAENQSVGLRHAEYYRDFLTAAAAQDKAAKDDRRADYAREIDNIRAALGWAFGPGRSASIDVALAAASAPVWLDMSLLSECSDWMVTGIGMTEKVMTRAFEPFFTTKEIGKGTGLGLSQVYGLVRQSGGTVRLHSKEGQGSEVEMWLPAPR